MSERSKPHNGRDTNGHFKVRQEDVEELRTDPEGETYLRDDVRLGGAVEDIGPTAGQRGAYIARLAEENRAAVNRAAGRPDLDEDGFR